MKLLDNYVNKVSLFLIEGIPALYLKWTRMDIPNSEFKVIDSKIFNAIRINKITKILSDTSVAAGGIRDNTIEYIRFNTNKELAKLGVTHIAVVVPIDTQTAEQTSQWVNEFSSLAIKGFFTISETQDWLQSFNNGSE